MNTTEQTPQEEQFNEKSIEDFIKEEPYNSQCNRLTDIVQGELARLGDLVLKGKLTKPPKPSKLKSKLREHILKHKEQYLDTLLLAGASSLATQMLQANMDVMKLEMLNKLQNLLKDEPKCPHL